LTSIEAINQLNRILKHRKILSNEEISFLNKFEILFKEKLVTLCTETYVKHVNRNDEDYYSIPKELRECQGISILNEYDHDYCQECSSEITFEGKSRFERLRVLILNDNLLQILHRILKEIGLTKMRSSPNWTFVTKNGNVFLLIYGINSFRKNHMILPSYGKEPVGIIDCKSFQSNNEPFIKSVWWVILNELTTVKNWLDGLSTFSKKDRPLADEVENYFRSNIDNLSPDSFEDYYKDLLNEISNAPINFQIKINELKQLSTNILGQIAVKVGAAGNPDIRNISKYKYYSVIFQPETIGDTKFYTAKTYVTVKNHLEQLIRHSRGQKGVIISSNNNIQSTIWEELFTYKIHNNNQWKYIVITRDMLKEIVTLFAPWLINKNYNCSRA